MLNTSALPRSRAGAVLSKLLFLARPVLSRGASRVLVLLSARARAILPPPATPCHDTQRGSIALCRCFLLTAAFTAQGSAHTLVAEKLSGLFGQELKQPKDGPGS